MLNKCDFSDFRVELNLLFTAELDRMPGLGKVRLWQAELRESRKYNSIQR